jgi:MFS family permease
MFGNYYAYDNPSALNQPLQKWMSLEGSMFNYWLGLCYSVYSIPNIILPLMAGAWIERHGLNKSLIGLSILNCVGQAVFSFGIGWKSFWVTLLGRFIFGLGGECLAVAQARLVTDWFIGKELALALGMNLSVARVGTIVNNVISAWLYESWGIQTAVWVGFLTCVVSLICSLITIAINDKYRSKLAVRRNMDLRFPAMRSGLIKKPFWILLVIYFLYYGAIIPYNNVASDLLAKRNFLSFGQASVYMSLPDFLAMLIVPLLGSFVDATGCKYPVILTGGVSLVIGHLILTHPNRSIFMPLLFLGVGYSSMLTFWALVPELVGRKRQALAYGMLTGAFNAAVSVIPLFVPMFLEIGGYPAANLFFTSLATLGTLLAAMLVAKRRKSVFQEEIDMEEERAILL